MISISFPDVVNAGIGFLVIFTLDILWLPTATKLGLYPRTDKVEIIFAIVAWGLLATAISCGRFKNIGEASLYGMFIGLVACGTWNFTEAAIRKDWRNMAVVYDLTYGTLLCTLTSVIIYKANSLI